MYGNEQRKVSLVDPRSVSVGSVHKDIHKTCQIDGEEKRKDLVRSVKLVSLNFFY